MHVTGARPAR